MAKAASPSGVGSAVAPTEETDTSVTSRFVLMYDKSPYIFVDLYMLYFSLVKLVVSRLLLGTLPQA